MIDTIVIEGNDHFSDSRIRKQMYSKTSNVWRSIRGDRRRKLQRETFQRDTLEVKYLYLTNGFLGVQVNEVFEPIGKDSAALIRLTINEGRQFKYGTKRIKGDANKELVLYCEKIAGRLKEGEPIDLFELKRAVFDMKAVLANKGFPFGKVDYAVDSMNEGSNLPITFDVSQDSLVHFGNVTVEGTGSFPENAARRELKIKKGMIYRRDDIIQSQQRLFQSGYFSTLNLKMDPASPDRLNPDFILRVKERKARYLTLRTGAGQSEVRDLIWDMSAGFGKRNFLGTRRYELLADYSFSLGSDSRLITHRYRLRYTEPWLFNIRMPLSLTFEVDPRIKDPLNDFDKRAWSIAATTRMQFGKKIRTLLGFQYEFVKISGVPDDQVLFLKQLTDNTARRKIFGSFVRDSRDDLFVPTRGVLVDVSGDVYGGFLSGDENFFKISSSWSRFERVWPGWIMATRVKGTWAEAFGKSLEVPLDEAVFLGGANTVRSFRENEIGRFTENGKPVAPRYTLVFNQEFRWRTLQVFNIMPFISDLMRSFPLWQTVFIDVGNAYRAKQEISLESFAYAYGTGVQIMTPAGPIRVDYARRIKSKRFSFADRWHFTILYSF